MPQINVDTPCAAYADMAKDWTLIDALLGGTREMRDKRVAYLPAEIAEEAVEYTNRLNRSFLKPALRNAIENGKGAVFRYEIDDSNVHPRLVDLLDDVDLLGNDMTSFLAGAFGDMLSYGHCHLLAAYPNMGDKASLADARAIAARPYGVRLDPRNVISWRKSVISGRELLDEVRFREAVAAPTSDWDSDTTETHVRVFRPGEWEEWAPLSNRPTLAVNNTVPSMEHAPVYSTGAEWHMIESGKISLIEIPLTTIYANRVDFMVSRPPFLDLAWLNLAHWQSYSDYRHILHVAMVPILFGSGMKPSEATIKAGMSSAILAEDPSANLRFAEHSGKAISAGRQELLDLEGAMERLGSALLSDDKPSGDETATATAIDTAKEQATLGGIIRALEDGANMFLWHMGRWLGLEDAGEIEIRRPIAMGGDESVVSPNAQSGPRKAERRVPNPTKE
jgi:uncharacterized protein DUF4055